MVVLSTRITSRTSSTSTPTRWSPRSTHHEPGLLADRRVELEPLPQIHHRHRAAFVGDHALEEVGRLGQRRGRHVPEDPLDLEDVERELLGPDPEGHELDVVAGGRHAAAVSVKRAPSAARSSSGTSPSVGAGDRRRPRQRAARGHGESRVVQHRLGLLDLEAEPAAGQLDQHAGVGALGQAVAAVEERAQMHQRQDAPPHDGDPADRRLARRAPGSWCRDRAPRPPDPAAGRPAGRRRAPAGAPPRPSRRAHRAAIRPSSWPTRSAIRPIGST